MSFHHSTLLYLRRLTFMLSIVRNLSFVMFCWCLRFHNLLDLRAYIPWRFYLLIEDAKEYQESYNVHWLCSVSVKSANSYLYCLNSSHKRCSLFLKNIYFISQTILEGHSMCGTTHFHKMVLNKWLDPLGILMRYITPNYDVIKK